MTDKWMIPTCGGMPDAKFVGKKIIKHPK